MNGEETLPLNHRPRYFVFRPPGIPGICSGQRTNDGAVFDSLPHQIFEILFVLDVTAFPDASVRERARVASLSGLDFSDLAHVVHTQEVVEVEGEVDLTLDLGERDRRGRERSRPCCGRTWWRRWQ